jgi:bis(5'-nucleosyl)-tetraphosphatase (symmetrical)
VAIYAIGDVQGCYSELCRLLEKIGFDASLDTLWFCGDLVNRGPESLETLRFVKSLGSSAVTVLGNHDLHLLALHHGVKKARDTSCLKKILKSPDRDELLDWLQQRPLLHYDDIQNTVLVHAGIHPAWGLSKARKLAGEVETALRGKKAAKFLRKMYYFRTSQELDFDANGSPRKYLRSRLTPWYEMKARLRDDIRVLFGHWSTLPVGCYGRFFALDGGCVWGGHMVALRIDFESEDWFFVDSYTSQPTKTAN